MSAADGMRTDQLRAAVEAERAKKVKVINVRYMPWEIMAVNPSLLQEPEDQ